MPFDKKLRGVLNTQDATISSVLLENFISFYDWGFVDKGAYYNIQMPASGLYGGRRDNLRRVKDPRYTDGTVYEAFRSNWVWETGVSHPTQPIRISGVYINNSFYPTGNVTYPFNIDYANGRVVFDNAIPAASGVALEYSNKWVKFTPANGIPWLRKIQTQSHRVDNPSFSFFGSGDWVENSQSRLQMPLVGVRVVPNRSLTPYQLGGGQTVNSDIIFYIFTENEWECGNIADIIASQNDRTIDLFDSNKVAASGVYPFGAHGYLNENALPSGLYPTMVDNFWYEKCYINSTEVQSMKELNPDLYHATVRCTASVNRKNL